MKNIVVVRMTLESGCDPAEGEYGLEIVQMIGSLELEPISDPGTSDPALICECFVEWLADRLRSDGPALPPYEYCAIPDEGYIDLVLKETGEWGPHPIWNKYYEVAEFEVVDLATPTPENR